MLVNYFRTAIRNLAKNKTFTLINTIGLALGMACGLGIFMIVHYENSFDNFHPNNKNIYRVVSDIRYPEGNQYQSGVPFPLPAALRTDFPQIKHVASVFGNLNSQLEIVNSTEKKFILKSGVYYANPDFFRIFHFKWLLGDPSVVLSQPNKIALTKSLAEQYFGTWQQATGKIIKKDNAELLEVAGILENPPGNTDFQFQAVISYPTLEKGAFARPILNNWFRIVGSEQCFIELAAPSDAISVSRQLLSLRPKYFGADDKNDYLSLQPLSDLHYSQVYSNFNYSMARSTIRSLAITGLFLLILACINFINLATAQAVKRSREVGIRKVLGSSRAQLALQFLGETSLIVLLAAALSVSVLNLLEPVAQNLLGHPVAMSPFQSGTTILFTVLVIISVTLLSGFYPALIVSGYRPIEAIKNKITRVSAAGISLRRVLVVFQFAVAQALIISTLVVISQVRFYSNTDLGFNKQAVVTVSIPRDSMARAHWELFTRELRRQHGIASVSLSFATPASQGSHTASFRFNQNVKDEAFELNIKTADTAYFQTYQLQLAAGKYYEAADSAREILVNETFVKKEGLASNRDAIDKYIMLDDKKLMICGVLKDFHQASLRTAIDPLAIMPDAGSYRVANIKLQAGNITNTMQSLQQIYSSSFPDNVFEYNFLDETIDRFYNQEQHLAGLFKVFAGIGIFISCIGLYGLVLFMTVQRVKEIGLRKVLGASGLSIVLLFFKEFIGLISIAFIIASILSRYYMEEWLKNFAYHTTLSVWMFAVVGIASLLIAIGTVSIQTIKAALANPVKSLRMD